MMKSGLYMTKGIGQVSNIDQKSGHMPKLNLYPIDFYVVVSMTRIIYFSVSFISFSFYLQMKLSHPNCTAMILI